MERREFLIRVGSLAIWVPAAAVLSRCGGNQQSGPPTLNFTSTTVNGHSHSLGLEVAILESPPPSGVQPVTSQVESHVHTVTLTMEDLQAIQANQAVTKTTSVDPALARLQLPAQLRHGERRR
jgi:hypothetical protein